MNRNMIWLAGLALLAVLIITGPVFAEGDEPPATPDVPAQIVELVEPIENSSLPENLLPEEIVISAENEEIPIGAETIIIQQSVEELEIEDPISFEPVLVDGEGNPMVLTTVGNAELIETADPYFTSGAMKYCFVPLTGVCNTSCDVCVKDASPIQASINYIESNGTIPNDGCIYVEKATYTGNVIVDGSRPYLVSLIGLTGLPDAANIFPTISGTLTLQNLTNGFSLMGFNVSSGVLIKDSSGKFVVDSVSGTLKFENVDAYSSTSNGIHIKKHKGNINFEDVNANNNTNSGLLIEDQVSGTVTINNSIFNHNHEQGIFFLNHKGTIIITNVNAQFNSEKGLLIETPYAFNISVIHGQYSYNDSTGIKLNGPGSIKIEDVTIEQNARGMDILGGYTYLSIKNTRFYDNWRSGLLVQGTGKPVILDGITAIHNNTGWQTDEHGIYLINVGSVTAKNLIAMDNNGTGVKIYAPNSLVTIIGAVAIDNNECGFDIQSRGVVLKNIIANDNDNDEGITIFLNGGSALLENVVANDNENEGIEIESSPDVITPINLKYVVASGNRDGGIDILSTGTVTILNATTHDNENYDGVHIETRGVVSIKNLVTDRNDWNGLYVRTLAAITLYNIHASDNEHSGADLDNCLYDDGTLLCLGTGGISLKNTSGVLNELNHNGRFGLWAVSKGSIVITNLVANENDSDGAFLTNRLGGSVAPITVNTLGYVRNEFSSNGRYQEFHPPFDDYYLVLCNGLSALSSGNIIVTNVDAHDNENDGGGIYLDTKFSTAPRTITLTNSMADHNSWVGVWAYSRGNIALTNVSTYENYQGGIHLDNCLDWIDGEDGVCVGVGGVKLTRLEANDNWGKGIEVYSKGLISLSQAYAHSNRDLGINLQNNWSGATAGMSLKDISTNNNNQTGLLVKSNGSITLMSINANGNVMTNGGIEEGITVQDFFNSSYGPDRWWFFAEHTSPQVFTLLADVAWGLNRFEFDPWIELYDGETGSQISVPVTCFTNASCSFTFTPSAYSYTETHEFYVLVGSYSDNGFYRLSLNDLEPSDSTQMFWVGGVGVNTWGSINFGGNNNFSGNSLMGLSINSYGSGNIILSNSQVYANGTEGIYLIANIGTSTLRNIVTSDNGWEGLRIETFGAVNINTLEANRNGQDGIRIAAGGLGKPVTLANIVAMWNEISGLELEVDGGTNGITTLNNVRAWFNTEDGANVNTNGNKLTLMNSSFMCNADDGFVYWGFPAPFAFINTNNIFLANDDFDLQMN